MINSTDGVTHSRVVRDDFLRASCDAIWETNSALDIVAFERPGPTRHGFAGRAPVGRPLQDLIGEPAGAASERIIRRKAFRFMPAGWHGQSYLLSGVPVFSPDGRFEGYRGVAVEDRRESDAQTAAHFVEEYHKVALALNDARWALGECRRTLSRREEAGASLLHELKTPLNAAVGYAELSRRRAEDASKVDQVAATLDNVVEALDHMTVVLSNASNTDRRPDTADSGHARVTETIRLVYRLMAPIAASAQVGLEEPGLGVPEDRTVSLGRQALTQVLINLLSNAIKFTPAGGRCGCRVLDTATGALRITVWDTGPGITLSEQSRVFQRHYRAGAPTNLARGVSAPGEGLGLAISRELARSAAGELSVESAPGDGAAFHLDLPRANG